MTAIRESLTAELEKKLPRAAVRSIMATLPSAAANALVGTLDLLATRELLNHIQAGMQTFGGKLGPAELSALKDRVTGGRTPQASMHKIKVASDYDVVLVQRASQTMLKGFFGPTDCVRLTTVVSELARNIYMYAGEGEVKLSVSDEGRCVKLEVVASDQGPGIPNVELVLSGNYQSPTGLGRGLFGAKRIFDDLEIQTAQGRGTTIRGVKRSRT